MTSSDWINIRRDHGTGIESVHAHFKGHAYDPHDHDEMLVGITQQGVQQFRCGRSVHTSTPGRAILIEPGALHDGHAPVDEGFTYAMLYLPQAWVSARRAQLGLVDISAFASFRHTLTHDPRLVNGIRQAFLALHQPEGQLARDQTLDQLLVQLSAHRGEQQGPTAALPSPSLQRVRDALHSLMASDIGIDELVQLSGLDRFRLTRQFTQAFGISPHAYLVRLRLRACRQLLAAGKTPAEAASVVGFADQSHMGRWFKRAYRMTPAAYQRECTNVLD